MQKARGHTLVLPLLVGIRFQVLLHSPHWGSFHLSLTVLVHYRSPGSIEPWKMVLPDSDGIPRVPPYSGTPLAAFHFAYETLTLSGGPLQTLRLCTCGSIPGALQPRTACRTVWAPPLSLAATYGISFDFFSFGY